jgi:outer membrane lipoprotein carrier protein
LNDTKNLKFLLKEVSYMKKSWITRLIILSAFVCFSLSSSAQAEEDRDLDQILSKLKDRFGAAKTLQADYVRNFLPKASSQLPTQALQAEGQLSFRTPTKLRLNQKKPRQEQLICNGEKVWWYIADEKLAYVYLLKDYYLQIKPILDFFSGLGKLDQYYEVRKDPAAPAEAPYFSLILQPKVPQPDLSQILIKISKSTFLPLEFSFYNLLGDGTRFRLYRIQGGVKLADAQFEFTPPPGTEVVSQGLQSPAKK